MGLFPLCVSSSRENCEMSMVGERGQTGTLSWASWTTAGGTGASHQTNNVWRSHETSSAQTEKSSSVPTQRLLSPVKDSLSFSRLRDQWGPGPTELPWFWVTKHYQHSVSVVTTTWVFTLTCQGESRKCSTSHWANKTQGHRAVITENVRTLDKQKNSTGQQSKLRAKELKGHLLGLP